MDFNSQVVSTTLEKLDILDEEEYNKLSKKLKKELEARVFLLHDLRQQIISLRHSNLLLKSKISDNVQKKNFLAKLVVSRRNLRSNKNFGRE